MASGIGERHLRQKPHMPVPSTWVRQKNQPRGLHMVLHRHIHVHIHRLMKKRPGMASVEGWKWEHGCQKMKKPQWQPTRLATAPPAIGRGGHAAAPPALTKARTACLCRGDGLLLLVHGACTSDGGAQAEDDGEQDKHYQQQANQTNKAVDEAEEHG